MDGFDEFISHCERTGNKLMIRAYIPVTLAYLGYCCLSFLFQILIRFCLIWSFSADGYLTAILSKTRKNDVRFSFEDMTMNTMGLCPVYPLDL